MLNYLGVRMITGVFIRGGWAKRRSDDRSSVQSDEGPPVKELAKARNWILSLVLFKRNSGLLTHFGLLSSRTINNLFCFKPLRLLICYSSNWKLLWVLTVVAVVFPGDLRMKTGFRGLYSPFFIVTSTFCFIMDLNIILGENK